MPEDPRSAGRVAAIARFPVKSMQGEALDRVEVTTRGLVGDRAYAVVDTSDGKVASAKNPRKWGRLLEAVASFVDEPSAAGPLPPVVVDLPDGTSVRSDAVDADRVLSGFVGREVRLTSVVPEGARFDEVWPEVEGLAPEPFIASTRSGTEDGLPVSDLGLAMAAPGTFFDLATLHVLTTSTLRALRAQHPGGDFDVRRYRPNLLVDTEGDGFVENEWTGRELVIGGVRAPVTLPTMRCVMTTLAQPGLSRDLSLLRTIAAANRLEIGGLGTWACAGVYANVATGGAVAVGDVVAVTAAS